MDLRHLFRVLPTSDNPSDYPRTAQITDDECLLRIAQLQELGAAQRQLKQRITELVRDLELQNARGEAQRAELTAVLRRLYPDVDRPCSCHDGGIRWVQHEGVFYFVGWGHDGEEARGQDLTS